MSFHACKTQLSVLLINPFLSQTPDKEAEGNWPWPLSSWRTRVCLSSCWFAGAVRLAMRHLPLPHRLSSRVCKAWVPLSGDWWPGRLEPGGPCGSGRVGTCRVCSAPALGGSRALSLFPLARGDGLPHRVQHQDGPTRGSSCDKGGN